MNEDVRELSTTETDAVRSVVIDRMAFGAVMAPLSEIASQAQVQESQLVQRFATTERLVDEVVAGVLRRSRPVVQPTDRFDHDPHGLIADLVRQRLGIDQSLEGVWHFIGQGEASALEFAALRSTMRADIECRVDRSLRLLAAADKVEAVRIIDGALSLAAVHSLRKDSMASIEEAAERLTAQIETLFVAFGLVGSLPKRGHLRLVDAVSRS